MRWCGATRGAVHPSASKYLPSSSPPAYGGCCFSGAVASSYLRAAGLPSSLERKVFDDSATLTRYREVVAKAVVAWAKDNGASVFTHWFQPLGSELSRGGLTGQVREGGCSRPAALLPPSSTSAPFPPPPPCPSP